ncbi:MAG: antitoxin family protein [Tepidisphaeraceae bacterium]
MAITFEATYENGVIRPDKPVAFDERVRLRVTAEPINGTDQDPLADVIGVCKDGPDISLAERHDELLYGLRKPASGKE